MVTENKTGKVYLVGAGPGDVELITVKGLECIKKADVLVYDRLATDRLLNYAGERTEKIFVGKMPDKHEYTQDEINEVISQKAKEGKIVTRLKGGDPFVFGRGGEEAEVFHGDEHWQVKPFPAEEIDPTGAGDCFDGAFIAALSRGMSVEKAAEYGMAAGALSVQARGPMEGAAAKAKLDELLG